jgi:hypothetical protein
MNEKFEVIFDTKGRGGQFTRSYIVFRFKLLQAAYFPNVMKIYFPHPTSHPSFIRDPSKYHGARGFALIATISVMVLLVMIALAMLSLSTIEMRSSNNGKAMAEAKANARMALMLAIGELQKSMGPDQRVSANGEILSDSTSKISTVNHPHWTGVWNSWRAGDGSPAGNDEPSQHATIEDADAGIHPSYEAKREDHFRSWLVSIDKKNAALVDSARNMTLDGSYLPSKTETAVILVGQGSLGPDPKPEDLIQVPLILTQRGSSSSKPLGRYGWWVGDESQKANIMDDSYRDNEKPSLAERLFRQQAPATLGNSTISGLEDIEDEDQLSGLPSRNTLALVGGVTEEATEQFHDITTSSLGVLADVREGGLKRDLSTILERTIDPSEVYNFTPVADFERASSLKRNGDDFMLYRFDNLVNSVIGKTGEANVPIQDLAAYYQLYNSHRSEGQGGIQYSSSDSSPSNGNLNSGIMVSNTDYGGTQSDLDNYLRQHSALYRNPVPVKIEIVLSYVTEPIIPVPTLPNGDPDPNADKYRLRVGISPAMTFWNPNNVPVVMNIGDPEHSAMMIREIPIPLKVTFKKSASRDGPPTQQKEVQFSRITSNQQSELYTLFVSGKYPAVFQPGESKVFSLRFASGTDANTASNYADFALRGRISGRYHEPFVPELELVPGWNPEKFIRPAIIHGGSRGDNQFPLTFKKGDYISASIESGNYNDFSIIFNQKSRHGRNQPGVKWHFRNYRLGGRMRADAQYKNDLVYQGFPSNGVAIADPKPRIIQVPARSADKLITAMQSQFNPRDDLPQSFFYYGIKAATETHESKNLSPILGGAGRRFPTRPFTHSTAMSPPFLDSTDPKALYNYGWNWFFMPLDNFLDAPISISNANHGYYGGGYTAENGTTHVVQQHLPITPPISIATLSHAHLGGFSLATEAAAAGYLGLRDPVNSEAFRRVTAIGFGGLAPHTLQAIGNSYAHPNIPSDKALGTWNRQFSGSKTTAVPFADHSYLANKALWDEFYFSSISPKPADVKVYSKGMSVQQVAREFFDDQKPLPNPRMIPYNQNMDEDRLDDLLSTYDQYKDGFADNIAAHLMVEGPFNINSTSVTAWKALFSSLKGKQVSYLDKDFSVKGGLFLDHVEPEGVPIAAGPLPNGKSYQGSSKDPSDSEQWLGWRELTDLEIDELSEAMVEQVKLRGPFLSLSEFVNRRLDRSDDNLSLMGALQAALDDPKVSINEGFRDSARKFTAAETAFVGAEFPKAMEGPIAYGSSAYVDQADILRSFPSQLTPRGDTFVIRAYGDSLDAKGNIQARAWCEAVVQRTPEYLDPADEPQVKQSQLTSEANKGFGRRFTIVKFSWLNASEI